MESAAVRVARAKKKAKGGDGDGDERTAIPWARFRAIAYGVLGWSAAEFADATMRDLSDGLDGWKEANGSGDAKETGTGNMTRTRMEELKAQYGD